MELQVGKKIEIWRCNTTFLNCFNGIAIGKNDCTDGFKKRGGVIMRMRNGNQVMVSHENAVKIGCCIITKIK